MFQSMDTEVNGLGFHYMRGGAGQPLILLHGVTDNGECWGRTAEALAMNYDVILLDQRGHGTSSAPEAGYHLDDFANDVQSLIEALGLVNGTLIGHSLGASVALRVAANKHTNLSKIILIDPPLPDTPEIEDATSRYEWFGWLRDLKQMTKTQLIHHQSKEAPHWSSEEIDAWAESKLQASQYLWGDNGLVLDTHWRDEMREVDNLPVQLIYGDMGMGSIISPKIANEAQAILQNGTVVKIDSAGHSIHRDKYEATIETIQAFLQRE